MSQQTPRQPLVPRSPTEVRAELVRARTAAAARAGVAVRADDVERGVARDLELVEGYKRGQDATRRPAGSPRPRPLKAERELAANPEDGLRLVEPSGHFERSAALHAPAAQLGMKWAAAVRRLGLIMEGATPAPTPAAFVATANCPDLALEWWNVYADYKLRHRQSRHNRFLDLSERDAARKLMRIAMDLCDRSTGRLGPWWVR